MGPTRSALALTLALCAAVCALPAHAQQDAQAPPPTAAPESPPPLPSPKPGPDNPQRHKLAVQQFLAWQQGAVDRSLYGDQVNGELNDEMLDRGTKTLANMGALQSATFLGTSSVHGTDVFVYKMTCEHGSVNMDFAIGADGKISLIFFE